MGCKHTVLFVADNSIPGQGTDAQAQFVQIGLDLKIQSKLYNIFRRIDRDGSHEISLPEFYEFFRLQESAFSTTAFNVMDRDGSGGMDFQEFVLSVWNYLTFTAMSIIEFAFTLYDTDQSMFLDRPEVHKLVSDVYNKGDQFATGNKLESRVENVLAKLDVDGDGRISLQEFTKFNQGHPLLLYPAYGIQQTLRCKILGTSFWERVTKDREKLFESKQITEILEGRTIQEYRKGVEELATKERYHTWKDSERNMELDDHKRDQRSAARRRKREEKKFQQEQRASRKEMCLKTTAAEVTKEELAKEEAKRLQPRNVKKVVPVD
jgi:Ca2+-binding EF-hand superfamily protein